MVGRHRIIDFVKGCSTTVDSVEIVGFAIGDWQTPLKDPNPRNRDQQLVFTTVVGIIATEGTVARTIHKVVITKVDTIVCCGPP